MYRQNRTLKRLAIVALILTLSAIFVAHAAAETIVYVNAPAYVLDDTFNVEIKIKDVYELDSGQFYLLFDPNVVDVADVTAGDIGEDMTIDFTNKRSAKIHGIGIIMVVFNIQGTDGVCGSGSLATVRFKVTGSDGTRSILNISNTEYVYRFDKGRLWDGSAKEIIAKWENDLVCIGDSSLFADPIDSGDSVGTGNSTDSTNSTDPDSSTDSTNSTDPDSSTDSTTSIQDTTEDKAIIYVANRDDDKLWVDLFIDGYFIDQYELKKDGSKRYCDGRRLSEGFHTFKIRWHDPDTYKDYVKIEKHNVIGETFITLRTDEHTEDDVDKLSATVHVKNLDDDDLDEVYLHIDGVYKKYKSIPSGSIVEYAEYEFEGDEDALHSFKIEWFDPGTDVTYEKIVRSYITGEEAITLYVDKHTKEDIILFPEATSTPVPTIPKSSSTSTRTVKEPTPAPTKVQITELHTDPAPTGVMTQHLSATCTMLAFVAVLFVLMQIRRI